MMKKAGMKVVNEFPDLIRTTGSRKTTVTRIVFQPASVAA